MGWFRIFKMNLPSSVRPVWSSQTHPEVRFHGDSKFDQAVSENEPSQAMSQKRQSDFCLSYVLFPDWECQALEPPPHFQNYPSESLADNSGILDHVSGS